MVVPYTRFVADQPFDTIVIGSGIGGMGLAALLAKADHQRVLVLERHYTAGGFTHVFHRPGFEWDVGVHYVGEVHRPGSMPRTLFDYLTGGQLAWQAMPDVYDRITVGDLHFDYVRGRPQLRDALARAFPSEGQAIDGYFRAIDRCLRRMPLYYVEKVLPALPSRLIGGALRAPFLSLARRTTADVLDDLGASPELRAVLTAQWGDYGLPPRRSSFAIHALVTAHYFDGAAYPVGGAGRIAESLLPTIEAAGGSVVVNAEVDRILLDGDRAIGVRMTDGRELRAKRVVSDAGVRATLDQLMPIDAPQPVWSMSRRVGALPPSLAHVCLYVGLDAARLKAPIGGANLWLHPGADFDRNLLDYECDASAPFPFLFISFPSAKDPAFARRHPGHETIEVVTLAPFAQFAAWSATAWHHRGAEYAAFKDRIAERLLCELHRHVPSVEGAVTTFELSTPLTTRHFAGSSQGEIYGVAHSPDRFLARDLRPRTPIRGLFLTGQDVGTCGVMGALSGAVTTASAMLGRNMFGVVARSP